MAGKGFMDPVLYKEDGQVFTTLWFTRGVCGRQSELPSGGVLGYWYLTSVSASSWQMFYLARILLLGIDPSQELNCMVAFRTSTNKSFVKGGYTLSRSNCSPYCNNTLCY